MFGEDPCGSEDQAAALGHPQMEAREKKTSQLHCGRSWIHTISAWINMHLHVIRLQVTPPLCWCPGMPGSHRGNGTWFKRSERVEPHALLWYVQRVTSPLPPHSVSTDGAGQVDAGVGLASTRGRGGLTFCQSPPPPKLGASYDAHITEHSNTTQAPPPDHPRDKMKAMSKGGCCDVICEANRVFFI